MNNYYDNLNTEVKEYFKILCPIFPQWLNDYINTPEMNRISKISLSCGTDYSAFFDIKYWYSNLDHSVGVALIIWNFTKDEKQTLAGLFHDIATPVFKHCIDFMNGDAEKQESTEERTTEIIRNSKEIMELLNKDQIKLDEVDNYKVYPIADNNTPKLSADRLEYTFSSGLTFHRVWDLDSIKKMYNNINIGQNEEKIDEMVFKDKEICEEYINIVSKLWPTWVSDEDRTVMQFLADMCKSMNIAGYLTIDELYELSESDIINKILNCEDKYLSSSFEKFQKETKIFKSDNKIKYKYSINVKAKTRYVNPLVKINDNYLRISDASLKAKIQIDDYLNLPKGGYWTSFNFDFLPYEK